MNINAYSLQFGQHLLLLYFSTTLSIAYYPLLAVSHSNFKLFNYITIEFRLKSLSSTTNTLF